ncbi:hypothetical protein D1007_57125 [Hordeum vulgare]|nr:hypothetical protein D1007_57125 [Hordeum vulgare]
MMITLILLGKVSISLEDPDYKGLELDVFCEKHEKAAERLVAFEGTCTGRRFLACAEPNLKFKNMKEKELLSEARMNLELKNAEFTKFEEKLSQEKLELKFQVPGLLKGKEKHNEEKYMLELKIVELMKAEEELKKKIKGI